MGQVTIDTDRIVHSIIKILAIIGLIAVLLIGWGYVNENHTSVSTPVVTTPTVATISYPSVLTFTVLSTTTSNGRYQVTTTSGNILYFSDYQTWDSMYPQNSYTATLVGTDGVGYNVGTVTWIGSPYGYYGNHQQVHYYTQPDDYYAWKPYEYPKYYYYDGNFYQCDRYVCDEISYKQAIGENLNYARPPRPLNTGKYVW